MYTWCIAGFGRELAEERELCDLFGRELARERELFWKRPSLERRYGSVRAYRVPRPWRGGSRTVG